MPSPLLGTGAYPQQGEIVIYDPPPHYKPITSGQTWHPTENRPLRPGDMVEVVDLAIYPGPINDLCIAYEVNPLNIATGLQYRDSPHAAQMNIGLFPCIYGLRSVANPPVDPPRPAKECRCPARSLLFGHEKGCDYA